LERRDPPSYSRGYSGFLNPLYEPGMSHLQIAERWLAAEGRRRPNFKQQLQDLEHGADLGQKAWVENEIESLLKRTGNPWRIAVEDVEKDLYVTNFTRMATACPRPVALWPRPTNARPWDLNFKLGLP
jgi:hypothetical protein